MRKRYNKKEKDIQKFQNKNKLMNNSKVILKIKVCNNNPQNYQRGGKNLKRMKILIYKIRCKMLKRYQKAKICRTCIFHFKILSQITQKIIKKAVLKITKSPKVMFSINQMIQKKLEL